MHSMRWRASSIPPYAVEHSIKVLFAFPSFYTTYFSFPPSPISIASNKFTRQSADQTICAVSAVMAAKVAQKIKQKYF